MQILSKELEAAQYHVKLLSAEEQLQLISYLAEQIRHKRQPQESPRWLSLRGAAKVPLAGEDAQDWISRNRDESDAARAAGLGN